MPSAETARFGPRAAPGSGVLARLARDLAAACADPAAVAGVEAVVPRRVADFRAVAGPGDGEALLAALRAAPWVRRCVSVPPHGYFDADPAHLDRVLRDELSPERAYGCLPGELAGRDVALAWCSPNANKPLHVGHARNLFLGIALANLLSASEARVFRSLCLSDYGIHVFKAAAQYLRTGDGATPESAGVKGDHFVGAFYAAYGTGDVVPGGVELSAEALSRLWMEGQPAAVELTRRLAAWAEAGFRETFAAWGARFDHWFRETEEQAFIDRFVPEQAARGAIVRDGEGRQVVEMDDAPPVPLLRSDGSTLYMSHMVAAILQRSEFLGPRADVLMSLTAQEQIPAFAQLARVLRRFGVAERVDVRHLWHGMVTVGGEKVSSREGAAATLDGVYSDLCAEYARRGLGELAPACARGALRLYLLGRPARKPLEFSLEACIATGGGLVMAIARTLQLTARWPVAAIPGHAGPRAAGDGPLSGAAGPPLSRARQAAMAEWRMKLAGFPVAVERAGREADPSHLVRWLAETCGGYLALARPGGDGAIPAEVAGLHLPLRRTVDQALRLLGAREVEFEMLPLGRDAAPGRGRVPAPALAEAGA